jgi:hypothetical protein
MVSLILLMLHNTVQATNAAVERPDEDKPESKPAEGNFVGRFCLNGYYLEAYEREGEHG